MSISDHMTGTVLAMTGQECVCIATDLLMSEGMLAVASNVKKVHRLNEKVFVGLAGLPTDCSTLLEKLAHEKNLYELREERLLKPKVAAAVLSNMLYSRRFGSYFVAPIIAGLDPKTSAPYICSMDSIGCVSEPKDFVAIGNAAEYALAVCEGFWRDNMDADELFEVTSQAFLSAIGRDASSGHGAVVYILSASGVDVKTIKTRMD